METEYIMGLPVDLVTRQSLIQALPADLARKETIIYKSMNPQIMLHARQYPEVLDLIEAAAYRIPDGIGIVKASQLLGGQIQERVAGIELMYDLLAYADAHQLRIFLYGAKPEVVALAQENIQRTYPGLTMAGYIDGYTSMSEAEIVAAINASQAQMVFVALGFPRQEQWLARNYQALEAQVLQDVGGSLDVISGTVKRAPDFFIKTNLEWAYRSLSNPKRMYRIFELPRFMWQAWRYKR